MLGGRWFIVFVVFLDPRRMKLISNSIPQNDILPPALTVRETLDYAARLRLEASSPGSRSRRVQNFHLTPTPTPTFDQDST